MNTLFQQLKPIIILFVICAVIVGGLAWLMNGGLQSTPEVELTSDETLPAPLTPEALEAYDAETTNDMNPIAVLNTNLGVIEIELFEDTMPITAVW